MGKWTFYLIFKLKLNELHFYMDNNWMNPIRGDFNLIESQKAQKSGLDISNEFIPME